VSFDKVTSLKHIDFYLPKPKNAENGDLDSSSISLASIAAWPRLPLAVAFLCWLF
jgi:hypothetical protein